MKYIESAQNETLKHLSKLISSAKYRRDNQQAVLEGTHLLDSYLQMQALPKQVYVPESQFALPEIQQLLGKLPENRVTVVSKGALSKISALTQGEEIATLIDLQPENQIAPVSGDCVVLERVQDAGNMGTILRSAAAAGVKQMVLSSDCVDVWSPKVLRAGMGAHFLLQICERVDLLAWRKNYRQRVLVTALSEHNNRGLYELDLREQGNAWVFGNEGAGVSADLIAVADVCVKIPMLGATESLNVAMAATICLFEQMRQRDYASNQ